MLAKGAQADLGAPYAAQVSHSVVLLALLFVSRLKQRNDIKGAAGSEYRLAVTALMLGNKILDDNSAFPHPSSNSRFEPR